MSGWLLPGILLAIAGAIYATITLGDKLTPHGTHSPGPAHPVTRALEMQRVRQPDPAVEAEIAWIEDLFTKDTAE